MFLFNVRYYIRFCGQMEIRYGFYGLGRGKFVLQSFIWGRRFLKFWLLSSYLFFKQGSLSGFWKIRGWVAGLVIWEVGQIYVSVYFESWVKVQVEFIGKTKVFFVVVGRSDLFQGIRCGDKIDYGMYCLYECNVFGV